MIEKLASTLVKHEVIFEYHCESIFLLEHDGVDFYKTLSITPQDNRAIIEYMPTISQYRIPYFPAVNTLDVFSSSIRKLQGKTEKMMLTFLEMPSYDESTINKYFSISMNVELSENTDIEYFVTNLWTIHVEFKSFAELVIENVSKSILATALNKELAKAA